MAKNIPKIDYVGNFLPFLVPVTTIKTLQKYFYLVVEVLSFDLVGHMWKFVKNWFEKKMGNSCGKILWEILWENLVGKSCVEILVGKFCGKFLGKSCRKFLWEMWEANS